MLTLPSLPPTTSCTVDEATAAAIACQFQQAAVLFERAEKELASCTQDDSGIAQTAIRATALLCWGMAWAHETHDGGEASTHLDQALLLFQEIEFRSHALLAIAIKELVNARRGHSARTDEQFSSYQTARRVFKSLSDESSNLSIIGDIFCLTLDVEIAIEYMKKCVEREDYDGVRTFQADCRRAVQEIQASPKTGHLHRQYTAYLSLNLGIVEITKGYQLLNGYNISDAKASFARAKEFVSSGELPDDSSSAPLSVVEGVRCIPAMVQECGVAELVCDGWLALLSGNPREAVKHFLSASALYDTVVSCYAEGGAAGADRLFLSAANRDQLQRLGRATELHMPSEPVGDPLFEDFVKVKSLAARLKRDHHEVLVAFRGGAWKLCLIGVGSILEATLQYAVSRRWRQACKACNLPPATPKKKIYEWKLDMLIDNAAKSGLIVSGNEHISDALRDYRNLAHPAKESKGRYAIDGATARASIVMLDIILRNVRKSLNR